MLDKITITDEEGKEKEVNLITTITLEEFNGVYVVYCEDELTDGENKICFAKMKDENGEAYLDNITNQEELNALIEKFKKEINNE